MCADGSFSPPSSRHDILVRNTDGSFDLTIADGSTRYHFGASGRLETIADEYANTLAYTYDANDRLQRVADLAGSGRFLDVFYGAQGRISAVQVHTGRSVQYAYDTRGVLTSATDPAGRSMSYSYASVRFAPLLTQIADPWGRTLSNVTYDVRGRTTTYTEEGETYTYTYNYNGRADQSSKVDSTGNRWVYTYAPEGVITQRVFPGGAAQQVVYNADKSVQQVTDEVGVSTAYTYGPRARLASVTRDSQGPSAVRFEYGYDPAFPASVTSILPKVPATGANDPKWQGWTYEYHPAGSTAPGAVWKVFRLRADGVTADLQATYDYNARGQVTRLTDPAGAVTDYGYDATGNLTTVTSPANNDAGIRPVVTYGHDSLGRVTAVTDPLGAVTSYVYDPVDRVTSMTLPKPSVGSPLDFITTYTYDSYDAGTALVSTTMTDPNGQPTAQRYDAFGRLVKTVDALGGTTTYGYTKGALTSITDANDNVTRYEYNGLGRLTATVFADGARETYSYDADGLLKTRTDRKSQTVTYTYDRHKRLNRKTYPNATYVQYTYDGQMLTQVYDNTVSPAETHTVGYDNAFRVTGETQGVRGSIGYTYTAADAVATMAVSGGPTATYAYHSDGSLRTIAWSVMPGEFRYTYRPSGQYETITMPSGQTRSYTYDAQGRLTGLANAHPVAGDLGTFAYGYDLDHATGTPTMLGQRVSMTRAGAETKYFYDGSYQLTRADYPNAAPFNGEIASWTYDAIGNRLTSTVNGKHDRLHLSKDRSQPEELATADGRRHHHVHLRRQRQHHGLRRSDPRLGPREPADHDERRGDRGLPLRPPGPPHDDHCRNRPLVHVRRPEPGPGDGVDVHRLPVRPGRR